MCTIYTNIIDIAVFYGGIIMETGRKTRSATLNLTNTNGHSGYFSKWKFLKGSASMTNQWKAAERYAYLGIAMCLLILVVISSISYQNLVHLQNDFKWVTRTRETLLNLSYFLSDLKDAEMGQRGYMLTGQESYLKPYQYIKKGVDHHFKDLHTIAADNIGQQKKLDALEALVTEQLSKLQGLVTLQKHQGAEAAKQAMITGAGKKIMDDIQTLILEMDDDERQALTLRSQKIAARVKDDAVVKGVGFILILITALLATSRVHQWFIKCRKAEKEQMDVINVKSDFVSMASHELRTPFKAIKESITIVLDGSAGQINNEQKQFLSVAKRNVDRLAKLIENILDFQKLNSGKMEFDMRDNDMNEVVEEVYELLVRSAQRKGLSLITEIDSPFPKVRFDKDQILQVLTNIVNNAIKFTERGDITITTAKEDNGLVVSVRDTGLGIAEEDLPKLFGKFRQLSNAKQKKTRGTGLGLAISKEIINQHNGKIWAQSQLGHGTTFCFLLPIIKRRGYLQKQNNRSKRKGYTLWRTRKY